MPFPQEFPVLASRQLGRLVTGTDSDKPRLALAIYELAGYGLRQVFGDAKYLMEALDPNEMATALASAPPEVGQFVTFMESCCDENNQLKAIPPFMLPVIFRVVEWVAKYLFERLSKAAPFPSGATP